MFKICVLTTLKDDPHTLGLFRVSRLAAKAGIKTRIILPGSDYTDIMEVIRKLDPDWLGLSYRLSPEKGIEALSDFLYLLKSKDLLKMNNGESRKVGFAGLPSIIDESRNPQINFPCEVKFFIQEADALENAKQVLEYFLVEPAYHERIIAEMETELNPPRIPELDQMARYIVSKDDYLGEPPLDVPSVEARESLIQRIFESPIPLLRSNFGVPDNTIDPTVEGIKELAEARVLDEISLGSSNLSQRYFGQPDKFKNRKNDGRVPYTKYEDLVKLFQATRFGNYPSMKPNAHTENISDFIDVCLKAGMLTGAHQAIPLFWFNELDGRGAMSLNDSVLEHLIAVRKLAHYGIPVEMNDPNQWASRWAHDAIIVAVYALTSNIMVKSSVKDIIHQFQFNKPRETGDFADLGKMTAAMHLSYEMRFNTHANTVGWKETTTSIDYLSPDLERAKFNLVRSTLLQLIINPDIIHLVSYCEANHVAKPADIIECSKLIRYTLRVFEKYKYELRKYLNDPIVINRKTHLLNEARYLLLEISKLSGKIPEGISINSLYKTRPELAQPDVLIEAVKLGYISAPGIVHPDFAPHESYTTGPVEHGFIDCLDSQTGNSLSERERLGITIQRFQ